jgi:AbrB family looped-hinge helix DNA binding protein
MVIPAEARRQAGLAKGDIVSVQPEGDGRLILVRLERPKPACGNVHIIRRKGKHAVADSGRAVSSDEVQKFIDQFP